MVRGDDEKINAWNDGDYLFERVQVAKEGCRPVKRSPAQVDPAPIQRDTDGALIQFGSSTPPRPVIFIRQSATAHLCLSALCMQFPYDSSIYRHKAKMTSKLKAIHAVRSKLGIGLAVKPRALHIYHACFGRQHIYFWAPNKCKMPAPQ